MGDHLIDGEFQSDKYPTCPRGKVPLSTKDPTAQDLLWEYAQRRRSVDAEFSGDLEEALKAKGYQPAQTTCERLAEADLLRVERALGNTIDLLGTDISAGGVRRLVAELRASWKEREEARAECDTTKKSLEKVEWEFQVTRAMYDKLEAENSALVALHRARLADASRDLTKAGVPDEASSVVQGIEWLASELKRLEEDAARIYAANGKLNEEVKELQAERDRLQSERGGMAYVRLEAEHKALREERDTFEQEHRAAVRHGLELQRERDAWKEAAGCKEPRGLTRQREALVTLRERADQVAAENDRLRKRINLLESRLSILLARNGPRLEAEAMDAIGEMDEPFEPFKLPRYGMGEVDCNGATLLAIEDELNAVRARLEKLEGRRG